MAMLEVKDINVYYGLIHALRDVSFEVNEAIDVQLRTSEHHRCTATYV